MSIQRTYQRKCDDCGKLHTTVCETARRSLAVMKHDGWVRRQMVVGLAIRPEYAFDPFTRTYEPTGKLDDLKIEAGKDFCPECKDKAENQ